MLSPCHPEIGTKATVLGLYPTFLMKPEVSLIISLKRSSDHYIIHKNQSTKRSNEQEQVITNLGGVHLVDGDDELTHTKGEGKKGMFTSLSILGDTSFEFTGTTSNNQNSAIGLRGTSDHVLDEITMSWGVNDLFISQYGKDASPKREDEEDDVR